MTFISIGIILFGLLSVVQHFQIKYINNLVERLHVYVEAQNDAIPKERRRITNLEKGMVDLMQDNIELNDRLRKLEKSAKN